MPALDLLGTTVQAPTPYPWSNVREFAAGDGSTAVFTEPGEFRMGATAWKLTVRDAAGRKTFRASHLALPLPYQPWSHDSRRLFLDSWDERSFFHDVASGNAIPVKLDGFLWSLVGSRRLPRFVAATSSADSLLDADGKVVRTLTRRRVTTLTQYLNWLDRAGQLFEVENHGGGLATIRFFDGASGDEVGAAPFNSRDVFPYDEERYRSLARNSFALVTGKGTLTITSYLDDWNRISFDETRDVLRMQVYRPAGDLFQHDGRPVCEVMEHWVEVNLKS